MYDAICALCGEYSPFCELHDELGVYLCPDCMAEVVADHKITGKFVVDKCECCGHIKGLKFIPYKKRGRPKGSKNSFRVPKDVIPLDMIGVMK